MSVPENVNVSDVTVNEIRQRQVPKNKKVSEKENHTLNKKLCH